MYSRIFHYFEVQFKSSRTGNVILTFHATFIAICVIIFLKYALRRRQWSKNRVTRKMTFFSPLGNVGDVTRSRQVKGISKNIYLLQILSGYRELFKNESFHYFWIGLTPYVVATKAKVVEELISRSKHLEKSFLYKWAHPWLGTGLITSDGNKWKTRRKLLTPSFHFDILKDFLAVFNEQSRVLVHTLKKTAKEPWTDIVKPITLCSLDIICESTLGVSIEAQKSSESEYVQAVSRANKIFMKRCITPPYYLDWIFNLSYDGYQFKKDVKHLHDFTRQVIADRKEKLLKCTPDSSKKRRKAFMDLLLEEHMQNHSFTEEDIREEVDTFTFAGHDTTAMGMSWALYLIGLYKKVQENINEELDRIFGDDYERPVTMDDLKDMDYLDRVLKESQRLYPSVPIFARKLSEDVTLSGIKAPKGVNFIISNYILHRDETVFPNPEKFDPDRFLPENTVNRSPYAYIPFSAGPRNCIGQRFAVMEEKVVISHVLRNYAVQSLDPRDKVFAEPELVLKPANGLRIKLKPRRPLSSN